MKIRPDIVRTYRDIHSWVGIVCGLFLFAAFYAGSFTMFQEPLREWAAPTVSLRPVPLSRMDALMRDTFAAHPEAQRGFSIDLDPASETSFERSGTLSWTQQPRARGPGGVPTSAQIATLDENGALVVRTRQFSQAGAFVNMLHRQVGLWLPHEPGSILMGLVALFYGLALVSGTLVILPGLLRNLFCVRIDGTPKRRWLDLHGMLGLSSLPFHVVMALTSVAFAFHDTIFDIERSLLPAPERPALHGTSHDGAAGRSGGRHAHGGERFSGGPAATSAGFVSPDAIVRELAQRAPGFRLDQLDYAPGRDGRPSLRASGHDSRYTLRGPRAGFVSLDPVTGRMLDDAYLPGHQSPPAATLTAFFALHFGSFGGTPIRWAYFVLGMAGAFMFFAGNRLWIVSRRRREAGRGLVDTRGTKLLSSLTVGCCGGCMLGIAATLFAAPLLPSGGTLATLRTIYWPVFLASVVLGFTVREHLALGLLLRSAGLLTLAMPLSWCWAHRHTLGTSVSPDTLSVNIVAALLGILLLLPMPKPRLKVLRVANEPTSAIAVSE